MGRSERSIALRFCTCVFKLLVPSQLTFNCEQHLAASMLPGAVYLEITYVFAVVEMARITARFLDIFNNGSTFASENTCAPSSSRSTKEASNFNVTQRGYS